MVQTAPRGRRLAHVAIATYVVVQIAAPVPALVAGFHETEGYFSWNMFAHRYHCEWDYAIVRPNGTRAQLDLGSTVNDSRTLYRLFHRDVLPAYHRWLCERALSPADGERLDARLRCAIVPGEALDLLEPGVDVCRARDAGVSGAR